MHDALYNLIRNHYHNLEGYVSAGMEFDKSDKSVIFMNANENPFELPGLEGLNRYPQPQPDKLLQAYADTYNVKPHNIVMTRGADEAISILTKLFCKADENSVIITPPTFGMYGVNARLIPVQVIDVPLVKTENGSFKLNKDEIIVEAKKDSNGVKLVFLCSPNNPTATSFESEVMIAICKELEGHAAVIIDETYIEFATQSSMSAYLEELPNLIILRTLSKSYALAGMRMGTILSGDKDFISLIRKKCLDAYPLPGASIDAALKALTPKIRSIAAKNIQKLQKERDSLTALFKASRLVRHIYPSDTNFILVEMDDAKGFIDYCLQYKVILRSFADRPLTKNCVRISVGTPRQNKDLVKLLIDYEKQSQADSAI